MKNTLKMIAGAALALVALTATVQAIPVVNGTIQMSGSVTFNTPSLATASSATFAQPTAGFVSFGTGSYSAANVAPGTLVSWSNFSWNPSTAPVAGLWSFTLSGVAYSFDLLSISSVSQSVGSLQVTGIGKANVTGQLSQVANWSFTVTDTSGGSAGYTFGFGNSNTTIPDGGATLMLLGTALSAVGLLRKKFIA